MMSEEPKFGSAGVGFTDGAYAPLSDLKIPVTDMGFQLSDMCYDAIHVRNGRFFRLQDHLDRWERSIATRRYDTLGYDRDQVADILNGCVARAGFRDAMVNFLATRGSPQTAHKDLRTCNNRFMAWAVPYYMVVSEAEMASGSDVVIAQTIRIPPESVDPKVKNYGRLDFVRATFEAYDLDAKYAVLLDTDGNVTEGRGWNIFAVRGGVLITPDRGALEGITRQTVLELAGNSNIERKVGKISADDLRGADEVFMSSTAGGIMPIRSVDKRAIGDGTPGPVTQRLNKLYWAMHDDPIHNTPVRYDVEANAH
jgi:branched-chain amino acid aminotransferase